MNGGRPKKPLPKVRISDFDFNYKESSHLQTIASIPEEVPKLLFQVMSDYYEKRSVIITSNLEFSKWNGIFFDDVITGAILDRLTHHCHLVVFTVKSNRLEHSSLNY